MSEERTLTFSQREGYEAVPGPLRLEELPATARTSLWNVLYAHLDNNTKLVGKYIVIDGVWATILRDVHAWHHHMPLDEWSTLQASVSGRLRDFIEQALFSRVFDLFEYIMRHERCPSAFVVEVSRAFGSCHLAYVIDVGPPVTILPAATPEEGAELVRNLDDLGKAGLDGCTGHLRKASQCINSGDWAGGVRESIHAVESVAKQVAPKSSKTLGATLNSLENQGVRLHPALKKGLSNLYGYTSDEEGIRHALLDNAEANVTIDEALFMLGACASFASYLWRKHQAAAPP